MSHCYDRSTHLYVIILNQSFKNHFIPILTLHDVFREFRHSKIFINSVFTVKIIQTRYWILMIVPAGLEEFG